MHGQLRNVTELWFLGGTELRYISNHELTGVSLARLIDRQVKVEVSKTAKKGTFVKKDVHIIYRHDSYFYVGQTRKQG